MISLRPVAQLYLHWTLDCFVEIAYALSLDAINRPQQYQRDDIPDDLLTIRMGYGTHISLPSASQRQAMIFPLLGGSDRFGMQTNVHSAFQTVRNELFNACAALPRQGVSHDKHLLETRIFSAAGLLRAHFERVRGKSFRMSSDQIRMAFDLSTSVIKNSGIATIFGASDLDPEWPLLCKRT